MASLEVSLDELHLDLMNPRFAGLSNQRDALIKIVLSQGSKLVNLAEDIVTEGMSPAHRMLVMCAPGKGNTGYIVMDGNRRLAALRVLTNPAVLEGMDGVGDLTAQKLRKLARDFNLEDIQPLGVFVCKNEAEARHWIEAIHTGENEGRGVVSWDGMATARYRGKNASLKVLDFIKAVGNLSAEELVALERFPITNLDRLLGSPDVRDRLGLSMEGGELLSDLPQSELLRPLKKIVSDLASKAIRVSVLKRKEDRIAYINSLGNSLPDLAKRTGKAEPLDRLAAHAQAKKHLKTVGAAKGRSLLDRKTLIPQQSQCPLNITNEKLQQICRELRRLPLDDYPVAIASTFRVFLELSLDHYGLERKLDGYHIDIDLKAKLERVAVDLIANGVHKRDLQTFRSLASNKNVALSIDRLHGVIHSRYALPSPSELRSGWAEVQLPSLRFGLKSEAKMNSEPRPSAYYTPLRYPGGKSKLVPYIKSLFEQNSLVDGVYVEPYAGGAAVAMELLLHEYVKKVYINDISAGVAAFWRSVLNDTDALCRMISGARLTMDEWYKQRDIQRRLEEHDDLTVAFSTFFLNRTNRSGILGAGVIGGKEQKGKWKMEARFNTLDLLQRIYAIARVRNRIEFHQQDALDFIDDVVPSLPTKSLIYLDPPYYVKGSNLYLHHYHHDDHVKIAKRVGRLRNKNWIVSYDNAPEISPMYSKARSIVYGLSYSAQSRYKGAEIMFFSERLTIPDTIAPMHLAA